MSVFFTLGLIMLSVFLPVVSVERSWGAGNEPEFGQSTDSQIAAQENAPAVTRWAAPHNRSRQSHAIQPVTEPSRIRKIAPSTPSRIPRLADEPEIPAGRIAIVVHQDVYDLILEELSQYEADLAATGYATVTLVFDSGTPEDLRADLAELYAEPASLVGTVLVGEIPYIIFEMYDEFAGAPREYTDFPCDLFFMDLDGEWADSLSDVEIQAGNGKYDSWSGNRNLEIWASRLKAANLTDFNISGLSPEDFQAYMLAAYFTKNHAYRVGSSVPTDAGLVYNDDLWQALGQGDATALSLVFGESNVISEVDPLVTSKTDYLYQRLPTAPQLIMLRSHGFPGGHLFDPEGEVVASEDYRTVDPHTPFFSLYVCSGSDFTIDNNLAGTITLNPDDSGLLAWGTTKTGGMWNDASYYEALAQGQPFGEAFRRWYNGMAGGQIYTEQFIREWWAGMVLIGDAALKPVTNASPTGSLTVTLLPVEASNAEAKWSVDGVTWRNSGETVTGLCILGEHTIHFADVPGWITPQRQRVTFRNGPVQTVSSTYGTADGTVDVTVLPQEAVAAGAQWSIDGGATWHNPGSPVSVPAGVHTVTFRQLEDWNTPASQSVTVQNGSISEIQGIYAPANGIVDVTVLPQEAVDEGAQWSIDGGTTWHNPGPPVSVPSGVHTVTFRQIAGWSTPASQSVTIRNGSTSEVQGTYNAFFRADFTATATTGKVPLRVGFQDNSYLMGGAPKKWLWDFGDGGKSTRQNPVYAYKKPGSYTVTLTVTAADGTTRVRSYPSYITPYAVPKASFTSSPARIKVGQAVSFLDKSTGTIVSRSWSFGNGQSSADQMPITTYHSPGRYTVSLMVHGPAGSTSTISRAITVLK
ncbi:MAG: PKD domain-containing protein [Syntrophobacteraceae bacterium]